MIEVKKLCKTYGDHAAVTDLSFTVEAGQVYGFLGPNGAGKSTTMNIITGCLAASSGQVLVDGHDVFEDGEAAKKLIGYLPEIPPLYPDMTPGEYLRFVGKAKGLSGAELNEQVEKAIAATQLEEMRDRLCKNLSKGYRQRVGIAQALLGEPAVIILDEPTIGLDPKQIIDIRDLIRSLGGAQTVILSSHILSEVRAVCDHVLIISHGQLVACDTPENLEHLFAGSSTIELTVKGDGEQLRAALAELPQVAMLECRSGREEGLWEFTITAAVDADLREQIFFICAGQHCPILAMSMAQASLEDIFLELTEEGHSPEPQQQSEETEMSGPEQGPENESEAQSDERHI